MRTEIAPHITLRYHPQNRPDSHESHAAGRPSPAMSHNSGHADLGPKLIKFAAIAVDDSADLVAAITAAGQKGDETRRIRVLSLFLSNYDTTACDVKFQSGADSDLTGLVDMAANGAKIEMESHNGLFETVSGEKLNIVLSAATTLGGWLTYIEV